MKPLTNERYYTILENCTIEAFESLKLKELYPKNGAKAIWDISSLTITKGEGLPTEKDNDLFRKEYILDNMRVTFLLAIERYSEDFSKKYLISRSVFYKKCYQSILFKMSNSPLWNEPDFGFNIDKEPCKLTFIWNMRTDIEARSIEAKQSKPQQNQAQPTEAVIPDQIKTDEIKIIDKLKQNEFDDVEPSKVYQHFKQLVDNKYITNENFNLFLRTVFVQNKTLTTKIEIIKPNSKQRVQKIFYSYFEKFVQNKYGTKQRYIDLLCNNFTGFNSKTLKTNFAIQ